MCTMPCSGEVLSKSWLRIAEASLRMSSNCGVGMMKEGMGDGNMMMMILIIGFPINGDVTFAGMTVVPEDTVLTLTVIQCYEVYKVVLRSCRGSSGIAVARFGKKVVSDDDIGSR